MAFCQPGVCDIFYADFEISLGLAMTIRSIKRNET